ncbi:hypothetical protein [uncultured Brevundimonas sp.]|uniref:hypothetical protein n=1 Tax=uncultured Brevundimonas sp. TaxID=213418 RepID=UPI0025DF0D46|nr:hypothetical protein [uncultured Brevundimonas sp.]
MRLQLAGPQVACLLLSACSSEPTFLRSERFQTLQCQPDEAVDLALKTFSGGKVIEFSGATPKPIRLQFVRGWIAEDYYRGSGVEAWVDPEIRLKFSDGRQIGPCN